MTEVEILTGSIHGLGEHKITFQNPFDKIPTIFVSLSGFDIDNSRNARISAEAKNISNSGFTLSVSTWADSKIHDVVTSWIAITN